MHQFKFAAYTALCSLVVASFSTMAQYPVQVKIMTYNINAERHTDGDYTDIGDVIKEINPTICGLQKVDSCSNATKKVDVLKSLGEQLDMVPTFSMSYEKNGGAYGNGFLSDSIPTSMQHLVVPKAETGASEDRSVLEIDMIMAGETVRFIVTHLDYSGATTQTAELETIIPWIENGGCPASPVVIMADFNAQATAAPMKLLTDAGFVFVKGKDGKILDTSASQGINHILYRPEERWKINDAGNPEYAASNRNPVWADMELLDWVESTKPTIMKKTADNLTPLYSRGLFHYDLTAPANVSLHFLNLSGERVLTVLDNTRQGVGRHFIPIGRNRLSPGIYHGILTIDGHRIVANMPMVR
jgi:endonuclease/exonuclease/phosphatase family metal-dependent hydrolase